MARSEEVLLDQLLVDYLHMPPLCHEKDMHITILLPSGIYLVRVRQDDIDLQGKQ